MSRSHVCYALQPETIRAAGALAPATVSADSHYLGQRHGEPLLVIMDGLLRYAKAYASRFDGAKLADDTVLGDAWLLAARSVRVLLNGDGAVAQELERTTDSKDNGVIESVFWTAIKTAGYPEKHI